MVGCAAVLFIPPPPSTDHRLRHLSLCRASAADCHEACTKLLAACLPSSRHVPFNVLATERLMMVVPRSRERCGPVSCNAVVFAGTLLVR